MSLVPTTNHPAPTVTASSVTAAPVTAPTTSATASSVTASSVTAPATTEPSNAPATAQATATPSQPTNTTTPVLKKLKLCLKPPPPSSTSSSAGTTIKAKKTKTDASSKVTPSDEWALSKVELRPILDHLFSCVYDYVDPSSSQRWIGQSFAQLPPLSDFPDYYAIITQPICLDAIANKINRYKYPGVEAMRHDMILLFSNAFTYNEPSSQVYKDAAFLQARWEEAYTAARKEREGELSALHQVMPPAQPVSLPCTASSLSTTLPPAQPSLSIKLPKIVLKRKIEPPSPSGLDHRQEETTLIAESGRITEPPPKTRLMLVKKTPSSTPEPPAIIPQLVMIKKDGPRKTIDLLMDAIESYHPDKRLLIKRLCKAVRTEGAAPAAHFQLGKETTVTSPSPMSAPSSTGINELRDAQLGEDQFAWAPLHAAAYFGHEEVVRTLLEHGANIELEDGWYGGRPLAWAAYAGHLSICKMLKAFGANISAANKNEQIAFDLLLAADQESEEWMQLLLPNEQTVEPAPIQPIVQAHPLVFKQPTAVVSGAPPIGMSAVEQSKAEKSLAASQSLPSPALTPLLTGTLLPPGGPISEKEKSPDTTVSNTTAEDKTPAVEAKVLSSVARVPKVPKGPPVLTKSYHKQARLVHSIGMTSNHGLMRLTLDAAQCQDGFVLTVPRHIGAFSLRLHLLPIPFSQYMTRAAQTIVRPPSFPPPTLTGGKTAGQSVPSNDLFMLTFTQPLDVSVVSTPDLMTSATRWGLDGSPPAHERLPIHDVHVMLAEGQNALDFCVARYAIDGTEPKITEDRFTLLIQRV